MPDTVPWNGDLVLFAHGIVPAYQPVHRPDEHLVLPDGTSIPDLANALGYAFAVSSYSRTGFAVARAIPELIDLVSVFASVIGPAAHVWVVGPSAGALISTLLVEQRPDVFSGGIAACGYHGNFRSELNYLHDVRLIFDYFFPGILPGDPVAVPPNLLQEWDSVYKTAVKTALESDMDRATQIVRVLKIPVDVDPASTVKTIAFLLSDHASTARNLQVVLGGQAYDNTMRLYRGSDNDAALNAAVPRFAAMPAAVEQIATRYTTSGRLQAPLVSIHTTGDAVIPYWQESLYRAKVIATGSEAFHLNIPVPRLGHCTLSGFDILRAFIALVSMSRNPPPLAATRIPR